MASNWQAIRFVVKVSCDLWTSRGGEGSGGVGNGGGRDGGNGMVGGGDRDV